MKYAIRARDPFHGCDAGQACYGTCPVYALTIHDDGRFEYHGARFVKLAGA
jgi:hypothetical protein